MLKTYVAVMLGGAFGTGLRLWLSSCLEAKYGQTFPLGTLVVNVAGSFFISFFAGLVGPTGPYPVSPLIRETVTVGVLGGFTTFSAFSLQTLKLVNNGDWSGAGANMGLSLGLCLLAVWLGQAAANALSPP